MRRVALALVLLVSACGGETADGALTSSTEVHRGSCTPTASAPFNGIAAVTTGGDVHVWTRPGAEGYVEFAGLGDDPDSPPTEGDGSFVETAAVVPSTCAVFVALCCEPVSGLTKWFASPAAEPVDIFGRLPAVSPDGSRVALAGYDRLMVASVDDPTEPDIEIALPADGLAAVLDMVWVDGDRLALLINTDGSVRLHEAVLSEGTLRPGKKLAAGADGTSALLHGVLDGKLIVNERTGSESIVESFDAMSMESLGTGSGSDLAAFTRRNGRRNVMISREGALSAWVDGDVDPTAVGSAYWWAG